MLNEEFEKINTYMTGLECRGLEIEMMYSKVEKIDTNIRN